MASTTNNDNAIHNEQPKESPSMPVPSSSSTMTSGMNIRFPTSANKRTLSQNTDRLADEASYLLNSSNKIRSKSEPHSPLPSEIHEPAITLENLKINDINNSEPQTISENSASTSKNQTGPDSGNTSSPVLLPIGSACVLFIANCRGKWSEINKLVDRTGATVVVHCGHFGFFDSSSLQGIHDRHLRQIQWIYPHSTETDRLPVNRNSDISDIRDLSASKAFTLSEMNDFVSGKSRFSVPVYVVYGPYEDIEIVDKLSSGQVTIPNLHVLHEGSPTRLSSQPPILLMGLGGGLVKNAMYDHADGKLCHAGSGGSMWTTVLQIGQLVTDAAASAHGDEVKVFVSSVDANEALISQIAMTVEADYCVCPSFSSPIATIYNIGQGQTRRQLYEKCAEFDLSYQRIFSKHLRDQIEVKASDYQRVLLKAGENVIKRLPASERDYSGYWNILLADAGNGFVMVDVQDHRLSLRLQNYGIPFGSSDIKSTSTDPPRLSLPSTRSKWGLDPITACSSPIPSVPSRAESTGRSSPASWPEADIVSTDASASISGTPATTTPIPSMTMANGERLMSRQGRTNQATHSAIAAVSADGERVGWETDSDDSEGSWEPPPGTMTVWVGNLPEDVTEEDVVTFFKSIPILRVKISSKRPDRRPTAYVDIPHADALERVLRCSGERIRGARLKIEYDPTRLAKIRDARTAKREARRQIRTASVESTPVIRGLNSIASDVHTASRPSSGLSQHRRPMQSRSITPRHDHHRRVSAQQAGWKPDVSAPPYVPDGNDHGSPMASTTLPIANNFSNIHRPNSYSTLQHPPRFGGPTSAPATAAPWSHRDGSQQPRVISNPTQSNLRGATSTDHRNAVIQTAAPAGWQKSVVPIATWDSPPRKPSNSFSTGAHWDRPCYEGPVAVVGWDTPAAACSANSTSQVDDATTSAGYSWPNHPTTWQRAEDVSWTNGNNAVPTAGAVSWNERGSWNVTSSPTGIVNGGMVGAPPPQRHGWSAPPAAAWRENHDHTAWVPHTAVGEDGSWRVDSVDHHIMNHLSNSNLASGSHISSLNGSGMKRGYGIDPWHPGNGHTNQAWGEKSPVLTNSALPPWPTDKFHNSLPRPSEFTVGQAPRVAVNNNTNNKGWQSTANSPRRHSMGGCSQPGGHQWDAAAWKDGNIISNGSNNSQVQSEIGGMVAGNNWTWK
ncbi:hypothetical protein SeMB42_g01446 [Synchytrium endobioticum]|uniref:RRM domain-containing protein n=1 Tax=Synchytrium endobioticum TaxID=286115 RepID=A0A507DL17_9FUNG|nr:hypothetical protein SeLEV6574_g02799 [Synchytrium endobioticum]TPX52389.1 hypothetical protein SeMB42_g01446 [Synchytrium endobioticum]